MFFTFSRVYLELIWLLFALIQQVLCWYNLVIWYNAVLRICSVSPTQVLLSLSSQSLNKIGAECVLGGLTDFVIVIGAWRWLYQRGS